MGKKYSKKIDDGILTYEFENSEGEVFSSYRINPTDIKMIERSEEVSKRFESLAKDAPEMETEKQLAQYNNFIEEQFNYLLGYEASKDLFVPPMTATTVLPSGDIFAFLVMDSILDIIQPELEKRMKKAEAAASKYLKKYESI